MKRLPVPEWEDFTPLGKALLTIARASILAGIIGLIYWLTV